MAAAQTILPPYTVSIFAVTLLAFHLPLTFLLLLHSDLHPFPSLLRQLSAPQTTDPTAKTPQFLVQAALVLSALLVCLQLSGEA